MNDMISATNLNRDGLRVAVISDIHGNLQALEAVLAEIEATQPDRIVVCGDVAAGPFPAETLARLMALGERAIYVRGNGDRELVAAWDSRLPFDPGEEDAARLFGAWCAQQIDRGQRDFLAGFVQRAALAVSGLGPVCFCHGSPRSDEQIITRLTPPDSLARLLAGTDERVVVCGHTHHQFDRQAAGYRLINPGSVGMPYQGQPGAYWALLGPGVELRRTEYDLQAAVDSALAAGYPDATYAETILTPPGADEAAAFFEQVAAQRGERSPQ